MNTNKDCMLTTCWSSKGRDAQKVYLKAGTSWIIYIMVSLWNLNAAFFFWPGTLNHKYI